MRVSQGDTGRRITVPPLSNLIRRPSCTGCGTEIRICRPLHPPDGTTAISEEKLCIDPHILISNAVLHQRVLWIRNSHWYTILSSERPHPRMRGSFVASHVEALQTKWSMCCRRYHARATTMPDIFVFWNSWKGEAVVLGCVYATSGCSGAGCSIDPSHHIEHSTENLGISVRVHVHRLQSFELERLSVLALVRASAYQG